MQIKFVGYGGAFDAHLINSSAIVELGGKKILIDCGHSVFPRLVTLNLHTEIDFVLITHLHDDHVGSLSSLLLWRAIKNGGKQLTVLYPNDQFKTTLHDFLKVSMLQPEKYCRFQPLSSLSGIHFINTSNKHVRGMPTYAYYFTQNGRTIVYSADLADTAFLMETLWKSGIRGAEVFHDVTYSEQAKGHAFYREVEPYQKYYQIRAYHCDPALKPADCQLPHVANFPEFLFTE